MNWDKLKDAMEEARNWVPTVINEGSKHISNRDTCHFTVYRDYSFFQWVSPVYEPVTAHKKLLLKKESAQIAEKLRIAALESGALDVGLQKMQFVYSFGKSRDRFLAKVNHSNLLMSKEDKGCGIGTWILRIKTAVNLLSKVSISTSIAAKPYKVDGIMVYAPNPLSAAAIFLSMREPERMADILESGPGLRRLEINEHITHTGEQLFNDLHKSFKENSVEEVL